MLKFMFITLCVLFLSNSVSAYESGYYNDNYYENNQTYCAPKEGLLKKIKNSIVGQPTGYTPQIEQSEFINTFGPSYMRGFYGRNSWADHNIYSPTVTGLGARILH